MPADYTELCESLVSDAGASVLSSITAELIKNPTDAIANAVKAHAFAIQGRLSDSAEAYQMALAVGADQPEIVADFIQVLMGLGDHASAQKVAQKAIIDFPNSANCHFVAANVFLHLGDNGLAEQLLRKTLKIKPQSGTAAFKLTGLLIESENYVDALHYGQVAVTQFPADAAVNNRLGHVLHSMGDAAAAIKYFRQVTKQQPGWHLGWHNLGRAYVDTDEPETALSVFKRAIECEPDNALSQGCRATELLKLGHWSEGWEAFEWRFNNAGKIPQRPGYNAPVWDGRALAGQSVMVWIEQGLGDNLQFLRFTRDIQQRGGKVWLQTPAACARLYQACTWIDHVITTEQVAEPFDYQIPLMSLPHVLGIHTETELSNVVPYLQAPQSAMPLIPRHDDGKFKVGIVWASSQDNAMHLSRDCPVTTMLALHQLPDVSMFSFQYGDCAAQLDQRGHADVIDLSSQLGDFYTTAGFIKQMDLMITVDTAMAHLAGALGANTWVLLAKPCDWRWLYHRADSPWYPSMRLFRQTQAGDWRSVMEEVKQALMVYIEHC